MEFMKLDMRDDLHTQSHELWRRPRSLGTHKTEMKMMALSVPPGGYDMETKCCHMLYFVEMQSTGHIF